MASKSVFFVGSKQSTKRIGWNFSKVRFDSIWFGLVIIIIDIICMKRVRRVCSGLKWLYNWLTLKF